MFMDDPVNPEVKVPVSFTAKLCDVIAKWEAAVKPVNNSQVKYCRVWGLWAEPL